ncbi:hypothetical protein GCM10009678_90310 [Actinomadura kijaniata]|uniref:Uncharacterized protein n=1 Tax=Actinomadura namibiensis TaxID=182080 RepID=A0A7W3LPI4_ACTNM|nr:hypothetical protein [Actinomadura namibiensis]MBA8951894.1 hypothetical protein [Actinomadura namibiensis]
MLDTPHAYDLEATSETRTRMISALRALADFLDSHPDIPVGEFSRARLHFIPRTGTADGNAAAIDRIAHTLGVEPTGERTGHYRAVKHFGPASYEAFAIHPDAQADHDARDSYYDAVMP